jgi:opacity protein-like surface antigen
MKTLVGLFLGLCTTVPAFAQPSALEPSPPRERPDRHVVLEPVVGVWQHTFRNHDYSAKPGAMYGVEVVIDPFRFLNVRGGVLRGNQPLSMPSSTLNDNARVVQPMLDILRMHLRVEPTWHYNDRLSLYLGLGMGWARFTADEPYSEPNLISFRRTGVYLAYEGAAGIAFEPILDWMVVDFSLAASRLSGQTGSAFESTQAFTEAGHLTTLDGLSKFSMGYRVGLGIGIVL